MNCTTLSTENSGKKVLALVMLASLLLLGACASAATVTPTPTLTPSPTPTPSTPAPYTINTASKAGIGDYLVAARGMTLYYFTNDTIGISNATGAFLQNWPIFNASNFVVPASLNAANFSTFTRSDGLKQATYKGWPLYYYAKRPGSGRYSW